MPPKKGKKDQGAKKEKVAADKTFGLKNKNKSAKVQRFVKEVELNSKNQAQLKKEQANSKRKADEKKAAEQAKLEAMALLNSQVEQKVPFGVDPKSVLCVYFRDGKCPRGNKCKFSHDMNVGKRATKKDLYTDDRKQKEADTMDQWDEAKLRSVIMSKQGKVQTTTDKVCKHFIDAVENEKYGWFWVCPNGGENCKYRHSLPEGYVLKTKEQKRLEKMELDAQPKITLEDFIETERDKLPKTGLTPVTLETLTKWKQDNKTRRLNQKKKDTTKPKLTGKQIIEMKFLDKNYVEFNDESEVAFDMSQFKQKLDEAEKFRDFGSRREDEEAQNDEETSDGQGKAVEESSSKDEEKLNGDALTTEKEASEIVEGATA